MRTDLQTTPLPASACGQFTWCSAAHVDDWVNGDDDAAVRYHRRPLTPYGLSEPYLVVEETRTITGVRYSAARIAIDDESHLSVDEFGSFLSRNLAVLPTWRDIAAEVEALR